MIRCYLNKSHCTKDADNILDLIRAGGNEKEDGNLASCLSCAMMTLSIPDYPGILPLITNHTNIRIHSSCFTTAYSSRPALGMEPKALPDRNVAWFAERPDESQLSTDARSLLQSYSKIPPEDVTDHVIKLRDEAWDIFPYPCIGQFRFLDLSLKYTKEYQEILDRLAKGQRVLDMACCFGQEIRQLVADGAPSENIYGCDLRKEYVELGYRLFKDHDRLQSHFLTADIFEDPSPLTELRGTFDVVYTGSFFHLFDYEDQVRVSKAVAKLLRPVEGSFIAGRQIGAVTAAAHDHRTNPTGKMYRHNPESLKDMWNKIGNDLGVTFHVEATLHELSQDHFRFHNGDTRRIHFTIRRG